MEINLIGETLKFLVLGMSTVFMFLVLMVLVVELQSKIVMRFFPQSASKTVPSETRQRTNALPAIAAIVAAIHINKMIKPKE